MALSLPSPVPCSAETMEQEMNLANSVLAIDASPPTAELCIRDICFAVQKQFALPRNTFTVSSFHSDFIIHLSTSTDRDHVLSSDLLYDDKFNMVLIPWSHTYKSKSVCWETEVAIDISNIPPHACFLHYLEPMLLPHCAIRSAAFNRRKGACRITGFAASVHSIPSSGHVGVQRTKHHGVSNDLFRINLQAYPLSEAPRFRTDSSPPQSPGSPQTLTTEFGVDPDVLIEVYEEQNRAEKAEEEALNPRVCSHEDAYCTSDFEEDEEYGWESDRSGHL